MQKVFVFFKNRVQEANKKAKKGQDRLQVQTTLTTAGTYAHRPTRDRSEVDGHITRNDDNGGHSDDDDNDDDNDDDDDPLDGPTDAFIAAQLRFVQDKIVAPLVKRVKRRAISASVLWADAHPDEIKRALNGTKKIGVWRRTVAELWAALPPEDQAHYNEQAKILKDASGSGNQWLEYVIFAQFPMHR